MVAIANGQPNFVHWKFERWKKKIYVWLFQRRLNAHILQATGAPEDDSPLKWNIVQAWQFCPYFLPGSKSSFKPCICRFWPRTCEQETSNEAPDDKRRSVKGYLGPLVNHTVLCVYEALRSSCVCWGCLVPVETDFLLLVLLDGPICISKDKHKHFRF